MEQYTLKTIEISSDSTMGEVLWDQTDTIDAHRGRRGATHVPLKRL
jgi:hypothetical protein